MRRTMEQETRPAGGDPAVVAGGDGLGPEREIGPYRLVRLLGEGGMGTVFLAEQTAPMRRMVALKLIRPPALTGDRLRRFEAEGQALARMSHPFIAAVYDAGNSGRGRPYLAMEYVPGEPITDFCDRVRMPIAARLALFASVCEGVQHAHQKAVLHRDLKPTNVLVADVEGRPLPKIIDFGIAKALDEPLVAGGALTQGPLFVGTLAYLSPEAIERRGGEDDLDTRTDVYSLGVLLFELLTGVQPFATDTALEALRQILEGELPAPSRALRTLAPAERARVAALRSLDPAGHLRGLAGDLDWIVLRAMHRDRERRYPSAADLAEDLRRHLRHEPVAAGPPSGAYRARKFVRRHRALVVAGAIAALALAGGVVARSLEAERANREAERANLEAATARQVADFLVDVFAGTDPAETRGADLTARELLDRGARRARAELGDQPALQARLFEEIGEVYQRLGLFDRAGELLEEALTLRRATFGEESAEFAESLQDLGGLAQARGELAAAEALFRRVLAQRERLWGPEHPEVAGVLDDISWNLQSQGRLAEAEEPAARALAIREGRPGTGHEDLAASLMTLAGIRFQTGRAAEAVPLVQRSLALQIEHHGADHQDVATARNNLAAVYRELGRLDEAEALYLESLPVFERDLGPDHPNLGTFYNNLGAVAADRAEWAKAVRWHRQAFAVRERGLPPGHALLGLSANNLGYALFGLGELGEARALIERGLAIREAALGADRPPVAESLTNLGLVALAEGRLEEAEAALRRALAIREAARQAEHPYTLGVLEGLAALERVRGREEESEALRARVEERRHRAATEGRYLPPPVPVRLPAGATSPPAPKP
ncbi:MAG: serine/threonine-protein kinase [Thermoanaerobaculia bacterium]|nr:serine/threonine-protein kinase [Thermoanaerobaculia bacterium]